MQRLTGGPGLHGGKGHFLRSCKTIIIFLGGRNIVFNLLAVKDG